MQGMEWARTDLAPSLLRGVGDDDERDDAPSLVPMAIAYGGRVASGLVPFQAPATASRRRLSARVVGAGVLAYALIDGARRSISPGSPG